MGMPVEKDISRIIGEAVEKRTLLFENPETDCFRIFNSGGDGIEGLTVDYYSGYVLLQYFNRRGEEAIKRAVQELIKLFPLQLKCFLLKNRINVTGDNDSEARWRSIILEGEYPDEGVLVKQNGVIAGVDLVNGQNTGIFLDMREVRDSLTGFYRETGILKMLNLFSYTALFSIHALKNGLDSSVNIDLSKGVLKRARDNYRLNGFKVDERDFIYGDAGEWTRRLVKKGAGFDIAVFDPPTFARNRKKNFSVKKDYTLSLQNIEKVVDEGFILSSVNSFTVTEDEYRSFHPSRWELLMFANESSDFVYRGNPYLKVGLWRIRQ